MMMRDAKQRVRHDEEEAMALRVWGGGVDGGGWGDGIKKSEKRRARRERRCFKVRVMDCLLNSNSLLLHLLQIWSSWSITNMAESRVFWTKPILINPAQAAFPPLFFIPPPHLQICKTSRNRGVEKESGHCVMSVLPAVLPRMGVPPEWAMNARD